jgi:hypothetical protein
MTSASQQFRLTIINTSLPDGERQRIVNCATLSEADAIAHEWVEAVTPLLPGPKFLRCIVMVSIDVNTSDGEEPEWNQVSYTSVEVVR